jgi:hypothetical protein
VRYEFHPINDADPYQDNFCTATHPIAAASGSSTSPATRPAFTAADPSRGPAGTGVRSGTLVPVVGTYAQNTKVMSAWPCPRSRT